MQQTIFILIVGIIIIEYILDQVLDYLNTTRYSEELPKELEGIYDTEKYKKSQKYERSNKKFSLISGSFSFIVMLAMLFFYGFAYVDEIARSVTENSILITLVFFGILMLASDIITTPFSLYDTFIIEEKYGFNKTTGKIFFFDKIKSWILGAVVGGGVLALITWFYLETKEMFWIYTWGAISLFMILMAMFYSTLIVPLFNKQTPLEDGELKDAIKTFCKKLGFKLDNVFVIDGSKRSSKANAYFTGLGSKKRIVLFDTLIKDFTVKEIVAVLAHEVGHYKKKHMLTGMINSIIQIGVTLYILSLLVSNPFLSKALGSDIQSFHLGLIAFGILYSPISTIIGLIMNIFSRKNEYAADKYAKDNYDGKELASALKKLSVDTLDNLTPHPAYVFFHYSHPTLLQRLKELEK